MSKGCYQKYLPSLFLPHVANKTIVYILVLKTEGLPLSKFANKIVKHKTSRKYLLYSCHSNWFLFYHIKFNITTKEFGVLITQSSQGILFNFNNGETIKGYQENTRRRAKLMNLLIFSLMLMLRC